MKRFFLAICLFCLVAIAWIGLRSTFEDSSTTSAEHLKTDLEREKREAKGIQLKKIKLPKLPDGPSTVGSLYDDCRLLWSAILEGDYNYFLDRYGDYPNCIKLKGVALQRECLTLESQACEENIVAFKAQVGAYYVDNVLKESNFANLDFDLVLYKFIASMSSQADTELQLAQNSRAQSLMMDRIIDEGILVEDYSKARVINESIAAPSLGITEKRVNEVMASYVRFHGHDFFSLNAQLLFLEVLEKYDEISLIFDTEAYVKFKDLGWQDYFEIRFCLVQSRIQCALEKVEILERRSPNDSYFSQRIKIFEESKMDPPRGLTDIFPYQELPLSPYYESSETND